MVHKHLM